MGRFDVLTQLDKESAPATPPPVKSEPVYSAAQSENQFASKPASTQTSLHANMQTRKPASMQTRKDVSMQTSKPVNQQTRLHANPQTGNQPLIVKYSTYLTPECKRALKRIAFESDRKDYEVLIEAVEQYLGRQKTSK
jgi:hypothetical protein